MCNWQFVSDNIFVYIHCYMSLRLSWWTETMCQRCGALVRVHVRWHVCLSISISIFNSRYNIYWYYQYLYRIYENILYICILPMWMSISLYHVLISDFVCLSLCIHIYIYRCFFCLHLYTGHAQSYVWHNIYIYIYIYIYMPTFVYMCVRTCMHTHGLYLYVYIHWDVSRSGPPELWAGY